MANTTNLNLVKLAGTEKLKTFPNSHNGNLDAIDTAFGAGFGVGTAPNVNTSINNLADGLAIVSDNNTHAAITAGQYVYVRNHGSLAEGLYVASANIAANGTLSGSNLTADSSGGLNSLNSNLEKVKYEDFTISLTTSTGRTASVSCGVTGYTPVAATFLQNDDLYYLTVTDGIYPNLSISTGSIPYIQIIGMNKAFNTVGATRNIKIRVAYTKA